MSSTKFAITTLHKYGWSPLFGMYDRTVWIGPHGELAYQDKAYESVRAQITRKHSNRGPKCHWPCREIWVRTGKNKCEFKAAACFTT